MITTSRGSTAVAGAALCLAIAGCGGSSASGTGAAPSASGVVSAYAVTPAEKTTTYPLTVNNCGRTLRFDKPPSRVLILNGASVAEVESFIVLGLQDRIVASAQSYGAYDDPSMGLVVAQVPTGGLSKNGNFDVPREQVLAMRPDLVVSTWSGGFDAKSGFATREELDAAGIASWVPPVNCAYGKPDASAQEKTAYAAQSIESSFEMLTELGRIFDVPAKAEQVVSSLRARIDAVRARVAGKPRKNVLIAYPGMSTMNASGIPAVMASGVANDVIAAAGGVNPFAASGQEGANQLSREQLAVTKVEFLAVGLFAAGEKADEEAAKIFAAFPQWPASKARAYTHVADGPYLGPANVFAVEKIATAVHPD